MAQYGGNYLAYVVVGVLLNQICLAALNGPFTTISEAFWDKRLETYRLSIHGIWANVLGRLGWQIGFSMLLQGVALSVLLGIGGLSLHAGINLALVAPAFALLVVANAGLGIAGASLFFLLEVKSGQDPITWAYRYLVMLFSGLYVPLSFYLAGRVQLRGRSHRPMASQRCVRSSSLAPASRRLGRPARIGGVLSGYPRGGLSSAQLVIAPSGAPRGYWRCGVGFTRSALYCRACHHLPITRVTSRVLSSEDVPQRVVTATLRYRDRYGRLARRSTTDLHRDAADIGFLSLAEARAALHRSMKLCQRGGWPMRWWSSRGYTILGFFALLSIALLAACGTSVSEASMVQVEGPLRRPQALRRLIQPLRSREQG